MALTTDGNLTSKHQREQEARKAYNDKLKEVPQEIKDIKLNGNVVLVRLYQFALDTITDSGIIVPKYKTKESEGGREKAVLDDYKYQYRGVIQGVGDACEDFTEENIGDTVWLNPRAAAGGHAFIHRRDIPVVEFEGFILIAPALIQATEINQEKQK